MKTIILTVISGFVLLLGLFFVLNAYIYSEKQADQNSTVTSEDIMLVGIVQSVDLTPMMVDGPARITILNSAGERFNIAVTSMGRSLCLAAATVSAPDFVSVGDRVEVFGLMSEEGEVVPCEKEEHYFKIFGHVDSPEVELNFEYLKGDAGYIQNVDDGQMSFDKDYITGYMLTLVSDAQALLDPLVPREGTPTIQVRAYNNSQSLDAKAWAEAHPLETNIELAFGSPEPVVVGGAKGVRYKADGLYASEVQVITKGSFVYVFTGAYLEAESLMVMDFKKLLESVTFTGEIEPTEVPILDGKLKADVFTGKLEEVNVGCFVDGECYVVVDGKHVTVVMGWSTAVVGSVQGVDSFGSLENHIGSSVEVYAQDLSDGTYTLYGSEGFYVKLTNGGSATINLGGRVSVRGVSINPTSVEEDSRCPIDVTCIQAGTVRVTTTMKSSEGVSEQVLTLGETMTMENVEVTLVQVDPTPHSDTSINNGEYAFTFKVTDR